jgi:hypothetical protein
MATFSQRKSIWNSERNIYEYYLTGSLAMNELLDRSKDIYIKEVRLHLNSPATQETFSVTIDSGKGTEFDAKLFSYDMSEDLDGNPGTVTDVIWRPSSLVRVDNEDTVTFTWTNTDGATWGLTVIVEE